MKYKSNRNIELMLVLIIDHIVLKSVNKQNANQKYIQILLNIINRMIE